MQRSAAVYIGLRRGAARSADLLLWQAVAVRDFLSAVLPCIKQILDANNMPEGKKSSSQIAEQRNLCRPERRSKDIGHWLSTTASRTSLYYLRTLPK